jgi:hypothetical protein
LRVVLSSQNATQEYICFPHSYGSSSHGGKSVLLL